MNPLGDNKLFYSVVKFNDLMYLGSNLGLFQFDPQRPNSAFRKVRTGLIPELVDANVVHAVDDVLWSIGPRDIARFDGVRWERIEDPDNGPIEKKCRRGRRGLIPDGSQPGTETFEQLGSVADAKAGRGDMARDRSI